MAGFFVGDFLDQQSVVAAGVNTGWVDIYRKDFRDLVVGDISTADLDLKGQTGTTPTVDGIVWNISGIGAEFTSLDIVPGTGIRAVMAATTAGGGNINIRVGAAKMATGHSVKDRYRLVRAFNISSGSPFAAAGPIVILDMFTNVGGPVQVFGYRAGRDIGRPAFENQVSNATDSVTTITSFAAPVPAFPGIIVTELDWRQHDFRVAWDDAQTEINPDSGVLTDRYVSSQDRETAITAAAATALEPSDLEVQLTSFQGGAAVTWTVDYLGMLLQRLEFT